MSIFLITNELALPESIKIKLLHISDIVSISYSLLYKFKKFSKLGPNNDWTHTLFLS